jgi:hypothetical protein
MGRGRGRAYSSPAPGEGGQHEELAMGYHGEFCFVLFEHNFAVGGRVSFIRYASEKRLRLSLPFSLRRNGFPDR